MQREKGKKVQESEEETHEYFFLFGTQSQPPFLTQELPLFLGLLVYILYVFFCESNLVVTDILIT